MNSNQVKFDQLDLNLLRSFAAIYQHRQLALAAQAMALTPSALSHALRRLRDFFADPLFERHGRQLVPTPRATQIAAPILSHLQGLETLLSAPQVFDPATSQASFTLGMPDALESSLLPELMRTLQSHQTNQVRLQSIPCPRGHISDALQSRQLDLVIDVALPLGHPVQHRALFSDHFAVLRHPKLPVLNKEGYARAKHIGVSGRAQGAVIEDIELLKQGIERKLQLRCQSYQSAAQVVADTGWYLTAPRVIATRLAQQFQLCLDPFPWHLNATHLRLYWAAALEGEPANQWLRDTILQIATTRFVHDPAL
ncbi:LysR family transcriptional regulator [Aliidiomarina sp. Khilg15.8]